MPKIFNDFREILVQSRLIKLSMNQGTNTWVYKHTGSSLHTLLEEEIGGTIYKEDLGLRDCHLGGGDI